MRCAPAHTRRTHDAQVTSPRNTPLPAGLHPHDDGNRPACTDSCSRPAHEDPPHHTHAHKVVHICHAHNAHQRQCAGRWRATKPGMQRASKSVRATTAPASGGVAVRATARGMGGSGIALRATVGGGGGRGSSSRPRTAGDVRQWCGPEQGAGAEVPIRTRRGLAMRARRGGAGGGAGLACARQKGE